MWEFEYGCDERFMAIVPFDANREIVGRCGFLRLLKSPMNSISSGSTTKTMILVLDSEMCFAVIDSDKKLLREPLGIMSMFFGGDDLGRRFKKQKEIRQLCTATNKN
jgi:hypothetical protein